MGASQKNHPACRGVVIRFMAMALFLVAMTSPARSETVQSLPPPPTVPSVGGWYYDTSILHPPFPGAATGQAVCDFWKNDPGNNGAYSNIIITFLPAASGFGGICTRVNPWGPRVIYIGPQPNYLEVCPPGYTLPSGSYDPYPKTCIVVSAPRQCPAVAAGEATYTLDPGGQTCSRPDKCPVSPLTQPPFSDACSTSLEAGKGMDVSNKCGTLREPDMVKAASCIADKINKLSSPPVNPKYTSPSATIRTEAYQNHLLEIWTKSEKLKTIMNSLSYSPETKQACVAIKASVLAEKQSHGIVAQPSSSGDAAPHVEHRAIDIPRKVANALMKQVTIETTTVDSAGLETTTITRNVEDYIHSATVNPPACDSNISWGGLFKHYDPVHFQLP